MQEQLCPFGPAFLEARTAKSISQWTVALRTQYHIRNIQRIERGEHQPGIMLAMRLVAATEVDVGEFFEKLGETVFSTPRSGNEQNATSDIRGYKPPDYREANIEGVKCLFGPLFQQARLSAGISQAAVAQQVDYSLRNIGVVEKGNQEPGVMTALGMVVATGVNVKEFFSTLYELSLSGSICSEAQPGQWKQ